MPNHTLPCEHPNFVVDDKYKFERVLGLGAYGVVCSTINTETNERCAIKKIYNLFERPMLTKRALRELKLLKHFNGHKNIIGLFHADIVDVHSFNEIYLYEEFMEADLHQIVRSGQPLTDEHYQSFIYQTCCGLKYIHSANVLHRDLKPGNLLVNADCELKICDFGLARGFVDAKDGDGGFMTYYVATRYYRAPEIMLSFQNYTKAIDMWSVGCIFAELLCGRPLFKGRDYVDQLQQILFILGTPDDETLSRVGSQRAQLYIQSLEHFKKIPFKDLYPNASPLVAIDLLERLLMFDPFTRIEVDEALQHPYFAAFHDPANEVDHKHSMDFSFESLVTSEDMKGKKKKALVMKSNH
ncbi:kinase-like domain-containing protein [Absidia repens]|uniref:Mitogen-activated protein kinase n=1 Tax=Absidia repens TaxID=90262 RepID=A0A1X2HZJ4_9FUNG|nr:kinase-like domain-containing protein [Absidia repens]